MKIFMKDKNVANKIDCKEIYWLFFVPNTQKFYDLR